MSDERRDPKQAPDHGGDRQRRRPPLFAVELRRRAGDRCTWRCALAADVACRYWVTQLANDPTIACIPLAVLATQKVAVQIELIAGGCLGPVGLPRN